MHYGSIMPKLQLLLYTIYTFAIWSEIYTYIQNQKARNGKIYFQIKVSHNRKDLVGWLLSFISNNGILSFCFRDPCSIFSSFLPWLFPSSSSTLSIFHSILFVVVFCKYIFSNTSVIKAKKIPRSSTATKETILLNEIGVSAFVESHPIDWSSVLHFLLCLWRAPVCLILL